MEKIKSLGSWDEIMDTLKKRLEEQEKRHQGGNPDYLAWIEREAGDAP